MNNLGTVRRTKKNLAFLLIHNNKERAVNWQPEQPRSYKQA